MTNENAAITHPRLPDDLQQLGAEPADVWAMVHAAQAVDTGLLVLTSQDTGLAVAAATGVALRETRGGASQQVGTDVHVARTTGATWSVADVEDLIVRPTWLRPYSRTHVIVSDAHRMAGAAADRLLKVIEEPRNDVLFWFTVPHADALSVTMRSRAARTLAIRPLSGGARRRALLDAGATETDAATIDELAGPNTRVALAVARYGLLESLRVYTHAVALVAAGRADAPTALGASWAAAIVELAHAMTRTSTRRAAASPPREVAWDKLSPEGKAESRLLVRAALDAVAALAQDAVLEADTPGRLRAVSTRLEACAAGHAEMDTHAPVRTVLTALAARSSSSAPAD